VSSSESGRRSSDDRRKRRINMLRRLLFPALRQMKPVPVPVSTPYFERLSKHRSIMPLYDLWPTTGQCYLAPSASVIGEVYIGHRTAVFDGAVVRGDINAVRILDNSYVGENVVIHTAASLPTGVPASVDIGTYVFIGPNSTLYSCTIDDHVHIEAGCIILEGARVEKGAWLGAGSVVPPGRLIPSKQLWAGNPVKYIRDIYENDDFYHKEVLDGEMERSTRSAAQFNDFPHGYMYAKEVNKY